ncbi:hypothetical protein EVAR_101606_1 [Eumeta japonica]|uniref:Uncharacterized protein n=1 Tax=Eumeta variegata TaxID=151549 RepID=A0A4C1TTW9_EUMVA|nr:hypothetical protein EVAR_101606_1 [Eumeta japonica]
MSNTDISTISSPSYGRRNKTSGTATQTHTTSLRSSESPAVSTDAPTIFKGLHQHQVCLPSSGSAASRDCLNKSSSLSDSPIRRVSSSLRNSVGFATVSLTSVEQPHLR